MSLFTHMLEDEIRFLATFAKVPVKISWGKHVKWFNNPKFVYIGPSFFSISNRVNLKVNEKDIGLGGRVYISSQIRDNCGYLVKRNSCASVVGDVPSFKYTKEQFKADLEFIDLAIKRAKELNVDTWFPEIKEFILKNGVKSVSSKIPVGVNLK